MQRAAVLWRASPARVIVALFALMLAAAMAVGSGANFNSTSANPGNLVTAGNLSHSNSKDGSAILEISAMKPGDSQTGTVTLSNDGDIPGNFTVDSTVTNDTPGPKGGVLSSKLDLKVDDITGPGAPVNVYTGKLGAMPSKGLGTWADGAEHVYEITVSWENSAPNVDNDYKKSKTTVRFDWESQS
jgi:spore coat-associated protein N